MLKEGEKAFDFTLPNEEGKEISLHDFLGEKVIVYFYPKDNTPGCTTQACAFRDSYVEYQKAGVEVIGISKDSIKSHHNFKEKQHLPFILLSDPELQAIQGFDVWQEKKLYGKTYMGIVRSTFIINEDGIIEKVFEKASPKTNASDILSYLSL